MEKLSVEETKRLCLKKNNKSSFDTPIRRAFEELKVGESICFTAKEWHEYYKALPHTSVVSWRKRGANKPEWELTVRKVDQIRTADKIEVTWVIVRTA